MLTANPKPNVVSNSWGGGSGQTWYNQQVTAWRQAGIIPVFAIGNAGPSCGSRNSPGDQPNLISVGATTNQDQMASFSSRGPGPNNSLKPEVSAPGQNIVSCGTGANDYVTMSGTSMATPHTAGAVCLLLSANPGWGFQEVHDALTSSAANPTLSAGDRGCGLPTPGQDFPNHAWGHGRIDVAAALRRLKK
jgi:subtilisin family serine protease